MRNCISNVRSPYLAPAAAPPITLRKYVERRIGRDARSQLANILGRPFGSATLAEFWQYWNPVIGYYLSYYCYRPLLRVVPRPVAVLATFGASGAIHDVPFAVAALVAGTELPTHTMTAMFVLLGFAVVGAQAAGLTMSRWPVAARWVAHVIVLTTCWRAALSMTSAT